MKKIELKFYTSTSQRYKHKPLHEWLIEEARKLGISKGTAIKGAAGFGKHGELLEEHFFETGSEAPIEIHLIVDNKQEQDLINALKENKIKVYYSKVMIEESQT